MGRDGLLKEIVIKWLKEPMTFSNLFAREGACHKAASAHIICSPANFLLVLENIVTSLCMQYALIIITKFPFWFRNLLQRIASLTWDSYFQETKLYLLHLPFMPALFTAYFLKSTQEKHQCFISVSNYFTEGNSNLPRVKYLNYTKKQTYEQINKLWYIHTMREEWSSVQATTWWALKTLYCVKEARQKLYDSIYMKYPE